MTISAKSISDVQEQMNARFKTKAFSNPKVLAGGAAAILLVLFMLFHSSGPGAGDLENALRAKIVGQMEKAADMASLIGGNMGGNNMMQREMDKAKTMKISVDILSKNKLDNGDWNLHATVSADDGSGRIQKDTSDFVLSRTDSGWKLVHSDL